MNFFFLLAYHFIFFPSCQAYSIYLLDQDWDRQNPTQIVTEMCGFVTILSGTFLLHKTKDMSDGMFVLFPPNQVLN